MAVFFPTGRKDEALMSMCSIYSAILRYTNKRFVFEDLFDNSNIKAVLDFPSHLAALAEKLGVSDTDFLQQLVNFHTELPLYAPFLSQECYERVLEAMFYTDVPNVHILLGIVGGEIPRNEGLQFCDDCVSNDRKTYGEAYIHRSHQVRGMKACSEHKRALKSIPILTVGLREFIYLEDYLAEESQRLIEENSADWSDYIYLAQETKWLLDHPILPIGQETLRQRYLVVLAEQGLATYSGEVRVEKLNKSFSERFSTKFLKSLGCNLETRPHRSWLSRLLQSNQPQNPLRHLLLMCFLKISVSDFIKLPLEHRPFGLGAWPCLNKICPHYKNRVIENHFLGYSPNTDRMPLGTFVCPHCGFVYSRVGPDRKEGDLFRIGRVVDRGHYWQKLFQNLWDAGYAEKYIASQLKVHPETVKRYAARLGLIETPSWLELQIDENASRFRELDLAQCKRDWLDLRKQYPDAGIADLIELDHQIYWTLFRLDAHWLELNSPKIIRLGRKVNPLRVDWNERDLWLLEHGPKAVEFLLSQENKPIQVTFNSIAHKLSWRESSITKNKKKLPRAYAKLSQLVESDEDFAIRRIERAFGLFIAEQATATEASFVKRAGLSKSIQTKRVMDYLQQIVQKLAEVV